jgi:hypothetical protein
MGERGLKMKIKVGLWIIPLEYSKYHDFRLGVGMIVF